MPNKKKRKVAAIDEADPASDAIATPPAKRGRPSKASKEVAVAEAETLATPTGKRGRPPKHNNLQTEQTQDVVPTSSLAKTNTNPPAKASAKSKATANTSLRRSTRANANADAVVNVNSAATTTRTSRSATNGTVVAVKETKPKGRANGNAKAASPVKVAKKGTRGFTKKPAKARGKAAGAAVAEEEDEERDESSSDENLAPEPVEEKPNRRGGRNAKKPVKARGKAAATTVVNEDVQDEDDSLPDGNLAPKRIEDDHTKRGGRKHSFSLEVPVDKESVEKAEDADEEDADEPNYWLMKAEPDSRMEKGRDAKFSIDDLQNASEPEAWDGVRNATARNNMRAMLKGDQAFFYHSNCKVPGIAGIMEIVEEHTPDETALDPEHPYHDPKSTAEKPKWDKVRVSFRRKFPELVKLKSLQKYAKEGGILQNMQTLKQSRLSVSKVSKKEWDFILLRLVGDEEAEGVTVAKNAEKVTGGNESGKPNGVTDSNGAAQLDGITESSRAGELEGHFDASTFGPGEGGVTGAESNLAAAWKKATGSDSAKHKAVTAET